MVEMKLAKHGKDRIKFPKNFVLVPLAGAQVMLTTEEFKSSFSAARVHIFDTKVYDVAKDHLCRLTGRIDDCDAGLFTAW